METKSPYDIIINENNSLIMVIREWLPTESTIARLSMTDPTIRDKYVTQEQLWKACETDLKDEFKQYEVATPVGPIPAPILVCATGDDKKLRYHSYGGRAKVPMLPWNPLIKNLRDRIELESGISTNSCLALKYRDGHDSLGLHKDKELIFPNNVVITVSLGQERTFVVERNSDKHKVRTVLRSGDLCLQAYDTQLHYRHGVFKEKKVEASRYALTFRELGGVNLR